MTIARVDARAGQSRADLRRTAVRSSGTLLLWIGAGLAFAGLAAVVLAWTVLSRTPWAALIAPGCFALVAGANFAWWGDRFRHYHPVFPSGAWGAVFATNAMPTPIRRFRSTRRRPQRAVSGHLS